MRLAPFTRMRRAALILACAALLGGCGSDEPESAAKAGQHPVNAPPRLAKLNDQASRLLDGGVDAFRARLRELRGYPVVVNKWASWCAPCRGEFPFFQKQALKRGAKVAFLGVNSSDNDGDAGDFLREFPVPFPSYTDGDLKIAAGELKAAQAFPATAFFDSKGELVYVHQGAYPSEEKLVEDIERYAG
jgi:cytochrome c biogenesis protein CcmG, thiol:disulfide interchange protein DsbE